MRIAIGLGLLGATLLLAGCSLFHHKPAPNPAPPEMTSPPKTVIKPDLRVSGQVAMVNTEARFVVISFPRGSVPRTGQRLNVYRNSSKVGEVTVTGPQHENDTVADINVGDIQVHDEAKAE
jgi:PBP1b-binding outer membrane lipoprotein LpoB